MEALLARTTPDPTTACRLWAGAVTVQGYPKVLGGYAHRLVVEHLCGRRLAAGECAMHSCDRPTCINPAHLSVGTQKDNAADRSRRGRHHRCDNEFGSATKLSNAQVAEMRAMRERGALLWALGKLFGVTPQHAGLICRGLRRPAGPSPASRNHPDSLAEAAP